jgi:hypothetical protein
MAATVDESRGNDKRRGRDELTPDEAESKLLSIEELDPAAPTMDWTYGCHAMAAVCRVGEFELTDRQSTLTVNNDQCERAGISSVQHSGAQGHPSSHYSPQRNFCCQGQEGLSKRQE